MSSLGPLVNTLYTHLPDLGASSAASSSRSSRRRTSSPYSRRRTRYSPQEDESTFGTGLDAFTSLFGSADTAGARDRTTDGVDLPNLLRTIVTEGRRQGIDAMSALRAAGRVQDELARFQINPTAWFEGVGDRFRTSYTHTADANLDQEEFPGGYNTRSRARQRGPPPDTRSDSWWWSPPKREQ